MNQPLLLHIVERLEGLLTKLPATLQRPILNELTPLKELFLQQRPPRLLLAGSVNRPTREILETVFGSVEYAGDLEPIFRWQEANICGRGTIAFLDARGAGDAAEKAIREELKHQDADVILFVHEGESARRTRKSETENLTTCLGWSAAKVIAIAFSSSKSAKSESHVDEVAEHLRQTVKDEARLLDVVNFSPVTSHSAQANRLKAILSRELSNPARIEMIRISHDRDAQHDVAQILVKSTTAICAAIGAQPIPLADLPILTTLQLVMVSGIMYVSGRERSLRAATEFVAALGANVGAGMVLREGARALLKFVPGWGNVICGMIAGGGTYAIGRAAEAFFLEGASLKQARQTYLRSRKKRHHPALEDTKEHKTGRSSRK